MWTLIQISCWDNNGCYSCDPCTWMLPVQIVWFLALGHFRLVPKDPDPGVTVASTGRRKDEVLQTSDCQPTAPLALISRSAKHCPSGEIQTMPTARLHQPAKNDSDSDAEIEVDNCDEGELCEKAAELNNSWVFGYFSKLRHSHNPEQIIL